MTKVKILTPLVLGTTAIVATLAAVMMWLEPQDLLAWLVTMIFLPASILFIVLFRGRTGDHNDHLKIGSSFRAALVGAGVLLASSLGFAVTDSFGLTGAEGQVAGTPIVTMLIAAVVVVIDLVGARLENAAEKDPTADKD